MKTKRYKNPFFWVGLLGVIFSTLQVEAASLNTWTTVWELIVGTFQNPYILCTTIMAVIGVVVDPSTTGIKDK